MKCTKYGVESRFPITSDFLILQENALAEEVNSFLFLLNKKCTTFLCFQPFCEKFWYKCLFEQMSPYICLQRIPRNFNSCISG